MSDAPLTGEEAAANIEAFWRAFTMTPDQVAEAAAAVARISWEAFYAPDDDEPEADATPDA